jgi:hypothetical protein
MFNNGHGGGGKLKGKGQRGIGIRGVRGPSPGGEGGRRGGKGSGWGMG